jgi:hypothetical protein
MPLQPALRRAGEALNGLDADDSGDHRDFEAAAGLAEVFLYGPGIEPPGDLLSGCDREVVASDFD